MPRKQDTSTQKLERTPRQGGEARDTSKSKSRSTTSPGRSKSASGAQMPPTTRQRPSSRERRSAELEMPPDDEVQGPT